MGDEDVPDIRSVAVEPDHCPDCGAGVGTLEEETGLGARPSDLEIVTHDRISRTRPGRASRQGPRR